MRSRQASNYGTEIETETEPFPSIEDASPRADNTTRSSPVENRLAASSSISGRLRRASQSFEVSNPPEGFMAATGTICSSIFTRQAVPRTSSNSSIPMQQSPAAGDPSRQSTFPAVSEEVPPEEKGCPSAASASRAFTGEPATAAPFENGYHFPPKHSAWQSTKSGCIAFWNYFLTPLGFCVTIYGLNVVAWGGMLFLLLCSPELASSIACPFPEDKIPDAPLTERRAPATPIWKLDAVIWLMVWNTFFQCCLAGFMWGMNRYNRPSWATGLFVGLACVVAAVGGIMMFIEGKKVKGIEGVPVSDKDIQQLQEDRERGIWHFNNIKDKDLTKDGKKTKAAKK
ncbi:hypothetical protein NW759_013288 [Fusarium solani]|nr:hypothetical protein NW759_013288 [Fusarium solani]